MENLSLFIEEIMRSAETDVVEMLELERHGKMKKWSGWVRYKYWMNKFNSNMQRQRLKVLLIRSAKKVWGKTQQDEKTILQQLSQGKGLT